MHLFAFFRSIFGAARIHFPCGIANVMSPINHAGMKSEIYESRIKIPYIYSGAALDPFSRRHASLHAKNSRDFNLQSALAFLIISIEQLKKKKYRCAQKDLDARLFKIRLKPDSISIF